MNDTTENTSVPTPVIEAGQSQVVVVESKNNGNTTPKPTGFQLHPENINRNGRPTKDWTWADLLAEAAEEMMDLKDKHGVIKGRSMLKKLVAKKMLTKAAAGDTQAAKLIMDRMDGMPLQATDITSLGEKLQSPLVVMDITPKEENNG